jgi:hypothetical protein
LQIPLSLFLTRFISALSKILGHKHRLKFEYDNQILSHHAKGMHE